MCTFQLLDFSKEPSEISTLPFLDEETEERPSNLLKVSEWSSASAGDQTSTFSMPLFDPFRVL